MNSAGNSKYILRPHIYLMMQLKLRKPTSTFQVISHWRRMRTVLVITTLLVAYAALAYCSDKGYESKQYFDNPYMWMMMNAGPQAAGLNPWVLLFLGIGVIFLSKELTVAPWASTKAVSPSRN